MDGRCVTPPPRTSLIEIFDCCEVNRQIGNKLNNAVKILKHINNDDVNMNDYVESANQFVCYLGIDP